MSDFKVALISEEFPPFSFGGISANCYDLAHSLSKKGISTTVFTGRTEKKTTETVNDNLQVVRLPFLDLPPRFAWFQIQNMRSLLQMLSGFNIIHGVNPQASAICSLFNKKLAKPFVTSVHEVLSYDLKVFVNSPFSEWSVGDFSLNVLEHPLNEFLIRTCLKRSDYIIACGYTTLKGLMRNYDFVDSEHSRVIYNGINFDKIETKTNVAKETEQETDCSIIFYGRLVWRKGIIHLIKAIALLKRDFPELHLDIFGRGPLEPLIRRLIASMDLADVVQVKGNVSYDYLIGQIKKSDIVALPSLYEVGPFIAALEGMACKKPLVTYNLPFSAEFLGNMQNAVLAEAGSVDSLAESIRLLVEDKELRFKLGETAHQYVKQNHDWDLLVDSYIDVYKALLQ